MKTKIEKRQIELDVLRIIAMYAVVMVHACGMGTGNLSLNNVNRCILTYLSASLTWSIPVFVMISGRFFLDPERKVSIHRIKKAIMRLCIAFMVWDVVYQFYYIITGVYSNLNWKGVIVQLIQGPYHFWYMYMLVGVYLLIPFLQKITREKWLMEYFIILFLVFEFLANYGPLLPVFGGALSTISEYISFYFALGYSGYFIAGYYLYKYPLSKKFEILIYIIGFLFWVSAAGLTVLKSIYFGKHDELFIKFLMPNMAIVSFAIYTFFVKRVSKLRLSQSQVFLISKISQYSAGIYYIHALVLEILTLAGFTSVTISPIIMVPLISLLAIIISSIIICAIRKIPKIGLKIT